MGPGDWSPPVGTEACSTDAPRDGGPVDWMRAGPEPKEKEGAEERCDSTCGPHSDRVANEACERLNDRALPNAPDPDESGRPASESAASEAGLHRLDEPDLLARICRQVNRLVGVFTGLLSEEAS